MGHPVDSVIIIIIIIFYPVYVVFKCGTFLLAVTALLAFLIIIDEFWIDQQDCC